MSGRRRASALCALGLLASLAGCGTAGPIGQARDAFASGDTDAALTRLDLAEVGTRDRLLGLMERGMILHVAGRLEESVTTLAQAVALIDELDATYVGEQVATLVTSEWASRYRGEYAEQLWIRTVQMANYLLLDDVGSAAVEARQAVALYERWPEPLARDFATRRLVAKVFETNGEYASAAIEYARLFELADEPATIAAAALPAARRAGRTDEVERYLAALASGTDSGGPGGMDGPGVPGATGGPTGSLVLLLSAGRIEGKRSGTLFVAPDVRISWPYYAEASGRGRRPRLDVRGYVAGDDRTVEATDTRLVEVAGASLGARGKKIAAKQVTRIVAKQGVVHAASHEDEVLGALVSAVFFLLENADTRSWRTLPADFAVLEFVLSPGEHDLVVEIDDGFARERLLLDDVRVVAGETRWREFRQRREGFVEIVPRSGVTPIDDTIDAATEAAAAATSDDLADAPAID